MHRTIAVTVLASLAALTSGCAGDFIRQDRSPVTLVIDRLQATSGSTGDTGETLSSDVRTGPGVISDNGAVTLRAIMKNPGSPANPVTPTSVNAVTITRYLVTFRRADGRNTPGVDVPFPFDSALTVTVNVGVSTAAAFELVRHNAKREAPLSALANGVVKISAVADVTFFGRDQAGNDLSVTGHLGITFGDFADPE